MANAFYFEFEKQFRGSRELIKERLQVYRPVITALSSSGKKIQGLDLGCGRGEWMECLDNWGVQCRGVDLDETMASFCKNQGFDVTESDAISFLKDQASNSLDLVTGFHIVEHLDQSELHELIREVQRVLCPGGVLIFETPNPENINVATLNFYLDPTHLRPLPPALLKFLIEYYGFTDARVLRLNSAYELKTQSSFEQVYSWYTNSYMDYSVIASVPLIEKVGNNPLDNIEYPESSSVTLLKLLKVVDLKIHKLENEVRGIRDQINQFKGSLIWRLYKKVKKH